VTPLLDYIQLEVGRNYPPPPSFLLQCTNFLFLFLFFFLTKILPYQLLDAKGLVASEEQQSEDFKITVANSGIVVSEAMIRIHFENKEQAKDEKMISINSLIHFINTS
jgi:hypothetical protein